MITTSRAYQEGRRQARDGRGISFAASQRVMRAFLLGVQREARRSYRGPLGCVSCRGTGEMPIEVHRIGVPVEVVVMTCFKCDGFGTMSPERDAANYRAWQSWCHCPGGPVEERFYDTGVTSGTECTRCGGIVTVG